jgi:hypothetical protein
MTGTSRTHIGYGRTPAMALSFGTESDRCATDRCPDGGKSVRPTSDRLHLAFCLPGSASPHRRVGG